MARTRTGRRAAFVAAVGGISLTSIVLVNVAADSIPWQGLRTLRDYMFRRNG